MRCCPTRYCSGRAERDVGLPGRQLSGDLKFCIGSATSADRPLCRAISADRLWPISAGSAPRCGRFGVCLLSGSATRWTRPEADVQHWSAPGLPTLSCPFPGRPLIGRQYERSLPRFGSGGGGAATQGYREHRLRVVGSRFDLTAMRLGNLARNVEPEPQTAVFVLNSPGLPAALQRLEHLRQQLRMDRNPGIPDFEAKNVFLALHCYPDGLIRGSILDGVDDQVAEQLLQPHGVPAPHRISAHV